jgi:hypothetical protein
MLGYLLGVRGRMRARDLFDLTKKEGLQPGDKDWHGNDATHCNEYVFEAAEMCGYDCWPLLNPKGIGWTNANSMYQNARHAVINDVIKEVSVERAQELTNQGRFVVVLAYHMFGGHGHCAVVQRFVGLFPWGLGPKIVQAGAENGEFWLKDIFCYPKLTAPMFVVLNKK